MTTVLGPLAGGVLVAATSPDWAYGINSVTFLFSAALILRIPARLLQVAQADDRGSLARRRGGTGADSAARARC